MGMVDLWSSFAHDPRDRANAGLRASDADRERITGVLSAAFADGRLEREELDERMDAVSSARTLGDLPPLVADLVPMKSPAVRTSKALVGVDSEQLHRWAVEKWVAQRRGAVFSLLASSLIFWGIWLAVDGEGFAWPAILSALALLNVARVAANRDEIVRTEVRRLEKKQARQQRWPKGLT